MSFLALAAAALISTSAVQPQESPTSVEDIEVRAEASRQAQRLQVERFVEGAMTSPRGRPLARWNKEVCLSAMNFQPSYGRALLDRIGLRMIQAGLDVKEEGCRPDVMIVATNDGKALARSIVDSNEGGLRPSRANTDLGSAALRAFQEADRPIRWWHVSLPVSADTGDIAVRLDGEDPPTITVREASRLRSNTRDDLARIIILVETSRLNGVVGTALADYLAFISMAQVDPDQDMKGFNTILNLLASPSEYTEMTTWDQELLAGLYSVDAARIRVEQQRRDISSAVVRQRGNDSEPQQD